MYCIMPRPFSILFILLTTWVPTFPAAILTNDSALLITNMKVSQWVNANRFQFNVDKTSCIIFSPKNVYNGKSILRVYTSKADFWRAKLLHKIAFCSLVKNSPKTLAIFNKMHLAPSFSLYYSLMHSKIS